VNRGARWVAGARPPDGVPARRRGPVGRGRSLVGLAGLALLATGAWLAVTGVSTSDRLRVLVWLVGGVAVHDGVVAPSATVLGRVARLHVPSALLPTLRVAGLALLTLVLLAVPLLATGGLRR